MSLVNSSSGEVRIGVRVHVWIYGWYVGYAAWQLSFHPSVPSLISFLHFCRTGRNRSDPDVDSSSSKLSIPVLRSIKKRTETAPFEIRKFQFQTRSILVMDVVVLKKLNQNGHETERLNPSVITNISEFGSYPRSNVYIVLSHLMPVFHIDHPRRTLESCGEHIRTPLESTQCQILHNSHPGYYYIIEQQ